MSRGRSPLDPPNPVRWCRRDSRSSRSRGRTGATPCSTFRPRFCAPRRRMRSSPSRSPTIPSVTAKARVRTVSPQADPVTRTFQVRLSLIDHPEAMRLGATVTGRLQLEGGAGISIPASALDLDRSPAGGVGRRSREPHGCAAQCRSAAVRSRDCGDLARARARRRGRDGGRPGACIRARRSGCSEPTS